MKVRSFRGKDIRTLAAIAAKNAAALSNVRRGADESADDFKARFGREVFETLALNSLPEIWAWVADIGGMTAEELDDAPVTAFIEIVETVLQLPDTADFFAKVSAYLPVANSEKPLTE